MHADNCFDISTYQRMLAGELPAGEMETVCGHLEKCERCLQLVRTLPEDSLVAAMRQQEWPANAVEPAFVRELAQKLLKQAASRGAESPRFVMFSCSDCGNRLKVKSELTGKKVKCPKCSKVVLVPAETASQVLVGGSAAGTNLPEEKTRAPQDVSTPNNLDAPTVPPAETRTVAPRPKQDTNLANQPTAEHDPDAEDDRSLTDFLAPPQQPDEIGRLGTYRVLKVLGAGGMGVVFKAEDPSLERMVAIKAMLPAIAASASARKRFLREAKAAAAIKHNNIVTIHQVGEDRGVPYLAMEFLKGEPLDERLKREKILPLAETLRIGREMAEGMAAAHEEGLIHRDIKPANTWLEASPGRKSGEYHVKILDFGLARSETDSAHLTQSGAIIGTPAYMSPEQGRGGKLDSRCDLWSLGVMFYRMCTGELPFKGDDTVATLMSVAMDNPPPPVKLNAKVPAELSNLVMKLLEKDPAKRIASAHEVAEALRGMEQTQQATQVTAAPSTKTRVTEHKPDTTAPGRAASVGDRRKSRKPLLLALAGGLVATVIAAAIVFFWPTPDGVIRVEINDDEIEVAFPQGGMNFKGKDGQVIKVTPGKKVGLHVKRGELEFDTEEFSLMNGETITLKVEWLKAGKLQVVRGDKIIGDKSLPKIEVAVAPPPPPPGGSLVQKFVGHTAAVNGVALSGDGQHVLTASTDKTAILWDAASGKKIQTFQGHTGPVIRVAFSRDGKHVLTGSFDKTASLWDAASGKKIQTFQGHTAKVHGVALSGDGKHVLTASEDWTAILWDAASGKKIQTFQGHTGPVFRVALSTDGQRVLTGSEDKTAILWDAASGKKIQTFLGHTSPIVSVALSGDGKHVVTGAYDKTAILWDAASGKKIQTFQGHTAAVHGVALSGDGQLVLTGAWDNKAILWDAASGKQLQTFEGHTGVNSVALSGDGKVILTGSMDGTAILWDVKDAPIVQRFVGHTAPVEKAALSGDGKLVLTGSQDKTAILWDAASGKKLQTFQGHTLSVLSVALSGDGKRVLTGSEDKTAILWEAATGKIQQTLEGHASAIYGVALSADGKHVLTGSSDRTAILWEAASGKKIQTFHGHTGWVTSVALSADGKHVVTGAWLDKTASLCLWEAASGKKIQTFDGHTDGIWGVALSGDGKHVLSGSWDATAILWDTASGAKIQTFQGHADRVWSVALSGDGKHVLTGSGDGTAILWEAASGQKIRTFQGHTARVNGVALSGDDKFVLTGSFDKTAILWDVKTTAPLPRLTTGLPVVADLDFAKEKKWGAQESAERKWGITNGQYQVLAKNGGVWLSDPFASPGAEFICEVEGRLSEPADGGWALGFELDNKVRQGWLAIQVGSDRRVRVFDYVGKPLTPWTQAPSMKPVTEANLLRVEAVNRQVRVFINGQHVCTADRPNPLAGDLHLAAQGNERVDARFSRLRVWRVEPTAKLIQGTEIKLTDLVKPTDPVLPRSDSIVRKFEGHTDVVSSVALSAGGKYVLTGSTDKTAILWERASGKKVQTYQGHTAAVIRVALSGDDQLVLTGAQDNTAILWETATGKKVQTFRGHSHHVVAVALSSDGKRVLTGSADATAILWDAASGAKIQTFLGHAYNINSVALSADGNFVLTGSGDKSAILWDAATGKKIQTFQGHGGAVTGVALSSDGKRVLTGAWDKTVSAILWDAASGKPIKSFAGNPGATMSVALSGDGKLVLIGARNHTAILWDAASGNRLQTFQGHTGPVHSVALSGDGKQVLTGSEDKTAILWEVKAPQAPDARPVSLVQIFKGHAFRVKGVAVSGDGKRVLTTSADRTAALWDTEFGKKLQTFKGHTAEVLSVALSGDCKHVLTGSADNSAALWETFDGKKLQTFQGHTGPVSGVALSGDGKHVFTSSLDSTAIQWDAATGKIIQTFQNGHTGPISGLALSGDGASLVTCGHDKTAVLWLVAGGKKLRTFEGGHEKQINCVALSGDGRLALTGGDDSRAILWDTESGKKLQTSFAQKAVAGVSLSRDGKYALVGSAEGSSLWETAGGKGLHHFSGSRDQAEPVLSVALSSDGRYVVIGLEDRTALLWEVAPPRAAVVKGYFGGFNFRGTDGTFWLQIHHKIPHKDFTNGLTTQTPYQCDRKTEFEVVNGNNRELVETSAALQEATKNGTVIIVHANGATPPLATKVEIFSPAPPKNK